MSRSRDGCCRRGIYIIVRLWVITRQYFSRSRVSVRALVLDPTLAFAFSLRTIMGQVNGLTLGSLILAGLVLTLAQAQYFHPDVEDKKYLDRIETDVTGETRKAKEELVQQAKVVEDVATVFIGAKLKQNLFKALRVLAEKELASAPSSSWTRVRPKQEDEEEEETEAASGGAAGATAGGTTAASTNIIPQVANLVKAIFGGNSINLTSYVQAATKYLPLGVGNQVLGVVKLLAHNPAARWTTTTAAPRTVPTASPLILTTLEPVQTVVVARHTNKTAGPETLASGGNATNTYNSTLLGSVNGTSPALALTSTSTASPTTTEEDEEEEDEDTRSAAARQLPDPFKILGSLLNGGSSGGGASKAKAVGKNATTESPSGFVEEEPAAGTELNLQTLGMGIRNGLGDLIKVVPDLFKGAREAVGLLSGIQSLLGAFGGIGGS